jgi:hypothetical protein
LHKIASLRNIRYPEGIKPGLKTGFDKLDDKHESRLRRKTSFKGPGNSKERERIFLIENNPVSI